MLRPIPKALTDAGFASWAALADAVLIDRHYLSNVRCGRVRLSEPMRIRLAAALNLPTSAIELVLREGRQ